MFYSTQILGRKGPLGIVWMAAHHERIHKQLVDSTSIPSTVDTLLDGDSAPLALRLSGQLLLGIVRIYARKVRCCASLSVRCSLCSATMLLRLA